MDTANGGVRAHGGYHRVFGGHCIDDWAKWKRYRFAYGKELLKDAITPNGVTFKKVEKLTRARKIAPKVATKLGSVTVGMAIQNITAAADTYQNVRSGIYNQESFRYKSTVAKGCGKIINSAVCASPTQAVLGTSDLIISGYCFVSQKASINFEFVPIQTSSIT